MKSKLFLPSQFVPTQWNTAEDKAKLANHFIDFVESDFAQSKFPKWFYNRLSNCFGNIAHFNAGGFYSTFFENTRSKVEFISQCLNHGDYGSPAFTYCDVEYVLKQWLRDNDILGKYYSKLEEETNKRDLSEYQRLKNKFEHV
ncbi:MAG: hypothetical protein Q7R95_11360 [bacterium]|nr:hypothetical protein [bacterium]